ncbi:MAG TPA: UDP-N-acetylglucosamine pyrophosphorylase [Candidatus Scatavimonas merdigallinarum]|uniref:UDP-N-acetylglucosamine pyrophosphorylase n=1 Tax=Candidatus Scatavimonas merdigallinarum TaxID=2840914 RepID=A0A9D1CUQ3_9FIRM|nr:UDP-N-acetylglucosamine pyrophosphorylase [Candidatus Scatavimonas merdigallinarum]
MFDFLKTEGLLSLDKTIAAPLFKGRQYPWEVLCELSAFIIKLGEQLPKDIYVQLEKDVWVAKSAKIAKSASLAGPLVICENAEIRHCAFIRGNAIVGAGAVVGNSTEIKGSVLFDKVQAPHYNYVGDSILGYKAHLGAGAITSNLKSDKTIVCISVAGEKADTGRKKLGAIVGDRVEVGCNSVLNPGTVIGRDSMVYPLSMVRGYIPPNSIYKGQGKIVDKK